MKKSQHANSPPPQESDVIIEPDGTLRISFFWDDLADLPLTFGKRSDRGTDFPVKAFSRAGETAIESLSFPKSEYEKCQLCPKSCGWNRTQRAHPSCGDYHLRVATYGLTLGDEPEIKGKRGSGALMLSGCPLRCPSCHNPEMVKHGTSYSIKEFCDLAFSLVEQGAHNIQILSPTVHFPALRVALEELKKIRFPLPIILKSSGFERIEELKKFDHLVDIYLPDFKFGSCSSWATRARARNYFRVAQAAIHEMIRQVGPLQLDSQGIAQRGVLVRHVLSPLPPEEREEIQGFLHSLNVPVSYLDNWVSLE